MRVHRQFRADGRYQLREGSLEAAESGIRHEEMGVDVILGFVEGVVHVLERGEMLEWPGSRPPEALSWTSP